MFNHYLDENRKKITSYSFIKEVSYFSEYAAKVIEQNLTQLQKAKFDFIHIPYFEFQRSGCDIQITSEFVRGGLPYADVRSIYDDIVSKDWTFTDPRPKNFVKCKERGYVYMVDLDCFEYVPNRSDRVKMWLDYNDLWIADMTDVKYYTFDMKGPIIE